MRTKSTNLFVDMRVTLKTHYVMEAYRTCNQDYPCSHVIGHATKITHAAML